MSVFDDNITSEISQMEKRRYWFREHILEQFERYNNMHQSSPEYWDACSVNDGYITDLIQGDLADMWVRQYSRELREMGVYSTCTNVKKKIGVNKFRVIVRFTTNENAQSIMFPGGLPDGDFKCDEVEVKDLKF